MVVTATFRSLPWWITSVASIVAIFLSHTTSAVAFERSAFVVGRDGNPLLKNENHRLWHEDSGLPFCVETRRTIPSRLLMARRSPKNFQKVKDERPLMNEQIIQKELRVVAAGLSGEKDEPLGIMSRDDALSKAKSMGGLDLILINGDADPPVCKIVDYSKYRYMKEKKEKETKKKSKASELKEVKMSYNIDLHDYDVRKKNAQKFIKQGNRVKCSVMFRGREVQHDKLGYELLERLAEDLGEICSMEKKPRREGRSMSCILSPKIEIMKSVGDEKRAAEKEKKKKKDERRQAVMESRAALKENDGTETDDSDDEDEDYGEEETDEDEDDDDDDDVDLLAASLDKLLGDDDLTSGLFN